MEVRYIGKNETVVTRGLEFTRDDWVQLSASQESVFEKLSKNKYFEARKKKAPRKKVKK